MAISNNHPSYQTRQACSPNILIVGETGVGKSSIVNLIAGQPLTDVSANAKGCTMEATPYDVILPDGQGHNHHIRLFDTVGLNEPSLSKNDYFTAIEKANELIIQLQRTGGICLLIFCIRGGRITSFTECNYRLFCDILCQNQVPVAFVITGMENEHPMENWWTANAALFKQSDLLCTSHACVTATLGLDNVYAHQYRESQTAIRRMLFEHLSRTSWMPEHTSWFIHIAGELLKWVAKINDCKSYILGRPSALTVGELAREIEKKCDFSREEAVELAGKILAKRREKTELTS